MKDRIIIPVDTCDINKAIRTVETLRSEVGMFKFGLEIITAMIAELVVIKDDGFLLKRIQYLFEMVENQLFWDGKWNDIPNTIKGATSAVAMIKPKFFNVHASSGHDAVVEAVENRVNSSVLGVTVLTSLSEPECFSIFGNLPGRKVINFAKMLLECGAQGIICSPLELKLLVDKGGFEQLIKVTPGVRPLWSVIGDQKRVMTPKEAIDAGADYLVIGRPITNPPPEIGTPVEAARKIVEEMEDE